MPKKLTVVIFPFKSLPKELYKNFRNDQQNFPLVNKKYYIYNENN